MPKRPYRFVAAFLAVFFASRSGSNRVSAELLALGAWKPTLPLLRVPCSMPSDSTRMDGWLRTLDTLRRAA